MNNRPITTNEFLANPALLSAYVAAYSQNPRPTAPQQTIHIRPTHPPQQVGRKRPAYEVEQIQIVKERVDISIKKDHHILSNPDFTPFTSVQQVVERLLPWHCFQIHEYEHDPTPSVDIDDISLVFKKHEELFQKDQELQKNVYSNFITKLDDQSD
jgi:hypothetical protein